MSINIGPAASDELRPKITVIGVGGAGGNAIANMIAAEIEGVDFIVANTDAQALNTAATDARIQLGPDITGGLGAGARPEVGKAAAEETVSEIEDALDGVNMLFIAAGMGGGTGTGAAAVIAEAARRKGVLTVGVVTKPFLFEGTRRMRAAEAGIEELQKHVDTLIVIPNQNLFLVAKADTTFKQAFELADEVLQQGVRSITDLMVMPGLINLDFADVKSVMEEMGKAMMGTGEGEGENRALEAAERAIANPLLDGVSMQGAKGVIISIIGGEDMKLLEVDEAANHIRELVDEDANIIWGSAFNPDLDGKIRVSVVATGIEAGSGVVDASGETHSLSLGASRAPKRPVLELPEDEEIEGEKPATQPAAFAGLDLSDEVHEDVEEDDGDVDGIVDPLAGLRQDIPEPYEPEETQIADPADDSAHANPADGGGFASDPESEGQQEEPDWGDDPEVAADDEPLDLNAEAGGDADAAPAEAAEGSSAQDELLLNADKLAEEDEPVQSPTGKRRGLVSGGDGTGGGAGAGSTLFERMANLSRGSHSSDEDGDEDEDEDDKDGGALNIPRFLGRQNNQ
ncbi:cell division protein FtsZ [Pontixanthobacter aestiaquae]|uniref:Cell division protein FtsZ n=1 Tax=Pontixanthobacter aestiaquae TaxID=1509367 RepID=A0A844Z4Z7_9SPHN|nr:cell division protein FtsZ [Pontixanthobacter aestiaquae]MDN3646012.1 cell division protein FtsZ [Pontixanthobacter aestiaquae]MXO82995.1 cell division protein FtsZ [Pontixanthobacter aestiaquae]